MFLELITIGFMVGTYIYHRLNEPGPVFSKDRIEAPRLVIGTPIPMLFGKCRVRAPLLVWYGNVSAAPHVDPVNWEPNANFFEIDITFVLGIPFPDGYVLLNGIYIDDHPLPNAFFLAGLDPNLGGPYYLFDNSLGLEGNEYSDQFTSFPDAEFGDGNSAQTAVGSLIESSMNIAGVNTDLIPGYRNYVTFHVASMGRNNRQLPTLQFEVSSYPIDPLSEQGIGVEANPADVIYNLLKGAFAKLGMADDLIDDVTFTAAAETLNEEEHGYSRAIEDISAAGDVIAEILRQIDAVLFEDPTDGLIKLKLIRDDYVPADCLEINVTNCKSIETPAAGGWTGRINKVRVVFQDREANYTDGSAVAMNQANAVGQDNITEEAVIQMPGVCTQALADVIAARELSALSRPVFKCSAVVDRSFLRINPGDVVALTWPDWHINGMLMRVGGVSRGGPGNNSIRLDLIQDFFYLYRRVFIDGGSHGAIGGFPGEAVE